MDDLPEIYAGIITAAYNNTNKNNGDVTEDLNKIFCSLKSPYAITQFINVYHNTITKLRSQTNARAAGALWTPQQLSSTLLEIGMLVDMNKTEMSPEHVDQWNSTITAMKDLEERVGNI